MRKPLPSTPAACCCSYLLLGGRQLPAQPAPAFTVILLGVRGSLDESNFSACLVVPAGRAAYGPWTRAAYAPASKKPLPAGHSPARPIPRSNGR